MTARPAAASVGVVGHVEWVTHALGDVPRRGAIADLADPLEEPAGGGGVAAAAVARETGSCLLFTALGNDANASRAATQLGDMHIEVAAATRTCAQTPVLSITGGDGERTIMVVGHRLQAEHHDPLPWNRMAGLDGLYYAGEDPRVLARARAARVLVVTARRLGDLIAAGVRADVLVASGADDDEDPRGIPAALAPGAVVVTEGARGGVLIPAGQAPRRYDAVAPPGPVVDTYGCGDTFAAILTVALAAGATLDQAAARAARAAAHCATWRGGLGPPP